MPRQKTASNKPQKQTQAPRPTPDAKKSTSASRKPTPASRRPTSASAPPAPDLPRLKNESFFEQVYAIVEQIPKGRVTSYGAIARCLGSGLSARMVGWAMNAAHGRPSVPAQRVVNRNGQLSGKMHFSTPNQMEQLLKKDGVKVKDDTVVDFSKLFWDPAIELAL